MAAYESIDIAGSRLALVAESTFGTTPSTPTLLNTRIASEGLALQMQSEPDPEVHSAAAETDQVILGHDVSGQIEGSLYFDAVTQLILAHALRDDWQTDTPSVGTDRLVNSTDRKSLSIERTLAKPTSGSIYHRFTGCRIGGWELGVQARQRATFRADVSALTEVRSETAITGASYTAASTVAPMVGGDVGSFTVDSLSGDVYLQSATIRYQNQTAPFGILGQYEAGGISYGTRSAEVTLSLMYGADTAGAWDSFKAGTAGTLVFPISDPAGNTYTITLPKLRYTGSPGVPIKGNSGEVMLELTARAYLDKSTGTFMQIDATAA